MYSLGADLVIQFVDDSHVGECAPGHDLEVSSSRTVRVEVLGLNTVGFEVARGGRVVGDLAGRGDVIGRDRVAQVQDTVGALDVGDGLRLGLSCGEEGRVGNVSALRVPSVELSRASLKLLPSLAALEDITVDLLEHGRLDDLT